MRISTLGYVGKQGVKNIGRNKMFSIASIATMSACIFLFGPCSFYRAESAAFCKNCREEGVAITVFLMRMQQKSQIERDWQGASPAGDDVLKVEVCFGR